MIFSKILSKVGVIIGAWLLLCLSTTLTYHYTTKTALIDIPLAYAQNMLTVEEILNAVYVPEGNYLRISGGGEGGTSQAWQDITSGTNVNVLTMGSAGVLTTSGTGVINASQFKGNVVVPAVDGGTGVTSPVDDNVLVGNGTVWQLKTLPNCADSAGQHLNYTAATNAWSCGTTSSGGGSSGTFDSLTSGTNINAAMVVSSGASLTASGTGVVGATTLATGFVLADSNIPNLNVLSTGLVSTRCVETDGSGNLVSATTTCGTPTPPFNTLAAGTNTTAAMTVGSGASLATSGTGTIAATSLATSFVLADSNIPNLNVLSTGLTGTRCVETDASGNLSVAAGVCGVPGSTNFSTLTTGTNIAAGMTVGSGASLTTSGTGTINANVFKNNTVVATADGGTGVATATDDTVMVGNGTLWQLKALPNCTSTTEVLHYIAGTNTFSCDTISSGSTQAWQDITSGTNSTATMFVSGSASLAPGPSGTISANRYNGNTLVQAADGGTGVSSPTDDSLLIGNNTAWQVKTVPDCQDVTGQHLNYTASTNTITCGNSGGTGGSGSFSSVTSGANTTAAMVVDTGASLTPSGTGIIDASKLGGTAAASFATLAATLAGNNIFTNSFLVPKFALQTITSNAFAIDITTTGLAYVPALTAGVTVNAPTGGGGYPYDAQELTIVFLASATPQSITWNAIFSPRGGLALPTSVTGDNNTLDWTKFIYVASLAKYVMVASSVATEPGITTLTSSTTYTCPHLTSRGCEMQMTGTAGNITIAVPSGGAPANGKQLILKVKCTSAQSLILNTGAGGFIGSPNVPITGLSCPAAGPSWTAIAAEYSTVLSLWQVYATN